MSSGKNALNWLKIEHRRINPEWKIDKPLAPANQFPRNINPEACLGAS